jgi:hypothetical protein
LLLAGWLTDLWDRLVRAFFPKSHATAAISSRIPQAPTQFVARSLGCWDPIQGIKTKADPPSNSSHGCAGAVIPRRVAPCQGYAAALPFPHGETPSMDESLTFPVSSLKPECGRPCELCGRARQAFAIRGARRCPFAARCSSSYLSPPRHRSVIRPMPRQSAWMSRRSPIRGSERRGWGDFSTTFMGCREPTSRRGPATVQSRLTVRSPTLVTVLS